MGLTQERWDYYTKKPEYVNREYDYVVSHWTETEIVKLIKNSKKGMFNDENQKITAE